MTISADIHRQSFEAVERKDLTVVRQLLHDDYAYTGTDGVEQSGPDYGVGIAEMYINAFPDMTIEITNQYSPDDKVSVIEFVARGTHQGELQGVKPTGKKVEQRVCSIVEVRDGKIYRERDYFDNVVLMQQLGVMAAPTTQGQYGGAAGPQ